MISLIALFVFVFNLISGEKGGGKERERNVRRVDRGNDIIFKRLGYKLKMVSFFRDVEGSKKRLLSKTFPVCRSCAFQVLIRLNQCLFYTRTLSLWNSKSVNKVCKINSGTRLHKLNIDFRYSCSELQKKNFNFVGP